MRDKILGSTVCPYVVTCWCDYVSPTRESVQVGQGHCCAPLPGTEQVLNYTAAKWMNKQMKRRMSVMPPGNLNLPGRGLFSPSPEEGSSPNSPLTSYEAAGKLPELQFNLTQPLLHHRDTIRMKSEEMGSKPPACSAGAHRAMTALWDPNVVITSPGWGAQAACAWPASSSLGRVPLPLSSPGAGERHWGQHPSLRRWA